MDKAWNKELKVFGQCYEETDVLDSAVLIMPLVFFIQPVGPVMRIFAVRHLTRDLYSCGGYLRV